MTTGTAFRRIIGYRFERSDCHLARDDPHYEVESEKSGEHAVHRADALEKVHKH